MKKTFPQEQYTGQQIASTSFKVTTTPPVTPEQQNTSPTWQDSKFKVKGMHLNVRHFASGMVSVNSVYNPEIIAMLKEWKREGVGSYNPKYKSWNYWLPFSEQFLQRLKELNE